MGEQETATLLRVMDLRVGYAGAAILPPIRFEVASGQLWAVIGRNGSGKSTLLRTLLGLLPRVEGGVERAPGVQLAYLPQRAEFDQGLPMRVVDLVSAGLDQGWSFVRPWLPRAALGRVEKAMDEVGVKHLARMPFAELSEGQKQRVLLARGLVSDPKVLILDEPTSAMDQRAEADVFKLLTHLRAGRELAVLVVSHHLPVLISHATHLLMVDRDDQIALAGPSGEVLSHPLFRAHYGIFDVESDAPCLGHHT